MKRARMNGSLGTAAGLGAVSGLRTLAGVALLARELSGRKLPRKAGRLERWLAEPGVANALTVAAAGELLFDKLPGIPDRIQPAPLAGRVIMGALAGAVVADRERRALGAAFGAGAALAAAFTGWFLRREAARATMLPDAAVAIAEDAMAVAAARELTAQL